MGENRDYSELIGKEVLHGSETEPTVCVVQNIDPDIGITIIAKDDGRRVRCLIAPVVVKARFGSCRDSEEFYRKVFDLHLEAIEAGRMCEGFFWKLQGLHAEEYSAHGPAVYNAGIRERGAITEEMCAFSG